MKIFGLILLIEYLLAPPSIQVHARTYGDYTLNPEYAFEADGSVTFTLTRTNTDATVTFKYSTISRSATTGTDFTDVTDVSASISAGQTSTTFSVTIISETPPDADPGEHFRLKLSDFSDGSGSFSTKIHIIDDAPIDFNCPRSVWARENDGTLLLQLRRSRVNKHGPAKVIINTVDDGTAIDGDDFVGVTNMEVDFNDEEQTKFVEIGLVDDVIKEDEEETFTVQISGDDVVPCSTTATIVDDDAPDPFHCARGGSQPCLNGGTCNVVNGKCSCPSGYLKPNCARTSGPQTGCDDRCGANGWCQSDNAAPGSETITCVCKPGWAGELCDYPAYYHQCNTNSISFCITPYGIEDFEGKIYVLDKKDEFACTLEPALGWPAAVLPKGDPGDAPIDEENIPNWCRGYAIELDYNGGVCGNFGPITEGSMQEYKAEVVVQYSSNRMTSLDELVTASCKFDAQDLLVHTDLVEFSPSEAFLKKQTSTLDFSPAVMTVSYGGSGTRVTGPVQIDNSLKVCVSVENANDWDCVVINDIILNNTRDNPNDQEAVIYEAGCISSEYASVFREEPTWESGDKAIECFTFKLFAFDQDIGLSPLHVGISAHVSIYPTSSCVPLTCSGGARKKRSTANGEVEQDVEYVLELTIPDPAEPGALTNTDSSSTSANDANNLLPVVIGASVGGTFLIVVVIIIGFLARRRQLNKTTDDLITE